MEGDPRRPSGGQQKRNFNPLPPHGGRQYGFMLFSRGRDISIHSLRMEGDCFLPGVPSRNNISIHSLRMEGDECPTGKEWHDGISIHSLRMEGDINQHFHFLLCAAFQSTPSAWRETTQRFRAVVVLCISIHSLRMEGDGMTATARITEIIISIHSLRMEGDIRENSIPSFAIAFQSTPSAWRETRHNVHRNALCRISIHSLRMEGDLFPNRSVV